MLEMQRNVVVLRRWWWLVLLAGLVGGAAGYIGTKLIAHSKYASTALLSVAPAPQTATGLYVTALSASADAQLLSTVSTARAARQLLPAGLRARVDAVALAHAISGAPSLDGEIISVTVVWPTKAIAPALANAVGRAYVQQERARLRDHYRIIHANLVLEEGQQQRVLQSEPTTGQAGAWLRAQYSEAANRIVQNDADARVQSALQQSSLQLAQPAISADIETVGARGSVNAALAAALAMLVALVFAFVRTDSYETEPEASAIQTIRSAP